VNLPTAATHVEHKPSNPSIKKDEESRSAYMLIGALSMSLALSRFMATMALCPCPWRGSGGSASAYVLQADQDYWRPVVVMQTSRMRSFQKKKKLVGCTLICHAGGRWRQDLSRRRPLFVLCMAGRTNSTTGTGLMDTSWFVNRSTAGDAILPLIPPSLPAISRWLRLRDRA
jgi:hypothetical protein